MNGGAVAAGNSSKYKIVSGSKYNLPGVVPLGLNGAAMAAFGERLVDFGDALRPLEVTDEGVKLGESTLNRCFALNGFR